MAKINLTKTHLAHLEKAVRVLKNEAKKLSGQEKKELNEVAVTVSDILVRHENRKEKDY